MNIEKMREEFETWHVMNCSAICPHVGSEYKAWVASRESLVIELPERDAHELSINAMFGYDLARKDAIRAIEAAGLKVKP